VGTSRIAGRGRRPGQGWSAAQSASGASTFLGSEKGPRGFPPDSRPKARPRSPLSMPRLCAFADLPASGGLVRLRRGRPPCRSPFRRSWPVPGRTRGSRSHPRPAGAAGRVVCGFANFRVDDWRFRRSARAKSGSSWKKPVTPPREPLGSSLRFCRRLRDGLSDSLDELGLRLSRAVPIHHFEQLVDAAHGVGGLFAPENLGLLA